MVMLVCFIKRIWNGYFFYSLVRMNFYDVLVFMILNKVLTLLFLMVILYVDIIWVLYFLIGIKKNEFVLIDI